MARINRNFAKGLKADGTPGFAPTAFNFEGRDYLHPTAADYAAAGYLPVVDDYPSEPAPESYHYEAISWAEFNNEIRRVYAPVQNPLPAPRKWSRLALKTAFARAHILPQLEAYLSGVEVEPDYNGWQALTDCDYIEEGYGGAEKWAAMLDGAATALGKTRAEIDAFLDAIPREA